MKAKNTLQSAVMALRDDSKITNQARFYKTGPGQYGAGDCFLGISVPSVRAVVQQCRGKVSWDNLEECIQSKYHEIRLAALLALIQIFKDDVSSQQKCVDFYLAHTAGINNWDLVDLTCYELLGTWLLDRDRSILYNLARQGKTIWEQRIGIVTTMQFIRHGEIADTLAISRILLNHPHDLIHKAVGWLLREVGKRNKTALTGFLAQNKGKMSRTTLRYAIERFPEAERKMWLAK